MGTLRSGVKSDLLKCLTEFQETSFPSAPVVTAKILDGSAIVHMLNPGLSKTFGDYAAKVFCSFLLQELLNVSRLDVVWDTYKKCSLMNATREKRGSGQRTLVDKNTKIPKGWVNFLREEGNKKDLYHLLSTHCYSSMAIPNDKEFVITDASEALSKSIPCGNIAPCNHEEADTRIMLHVADAVSRGHSKVLVRTVDTDVVVLAVSCVPKLQGLEELWVHIGTGKSHQYLACHRIAACLGPEKTQALFHSLTGCDTTSSFNGRGKKTAFKAWKAYPNTTQGLKFIYEGDYERANPDIQKFIITMYDRSCSSETVNECRKYLFTKKDRQIENIPPTEAALKQHVLRAVFQGVHVWGQCLIKQQNTPCPSEFGWQKENDTWLPLWTDRAMAAQACFELIRCRCLKSCGTRCNCFKRLLKCTELCECGGSCK